MQIMDPTTHLWLVEQDRERAMTRRALQRAARAGGEQRPWIARGGILGFATALRRAGATISTFTFGGPPTTQLSGTAGI